MRSGAKVCRKKKFVDIVDLVKGFPRSFIPTSIHLQRFVSIQPRTSLSKFAKNSPKVRIQVRKHIGSGKSTLLRVMRSVWPSRGRVGPPLDQESLSVEGTVYLTPGGGPGQTGSSNATNFTGLVLGCIETKFCKKILVGKLSPRSSQCTPLHCSKITFF